MNKPMVLIRVVVATLFIIHGLYRIWSGIVDDFGVFFSSLGWPLGLVLAWAVTILEVCGGVLLLCGQWLRTAALYLVFQCVMGVALVH